MMRSWDELAMLHRILREKVVLKCLWFSIIQSDAIVLAQNLVVPMANATTFAWRLLYQKMNYYDAQMHYA